MSWIALVYKNQDAVQREIVMADLGDLGYESFTDEDEILTAYKKGGNLEEEIKILGDFFGDSYVFELSLMEDENWNEKWESNFEPIVVREAIYVRADFHPSNAGFPYEIIINPKMSFGTGHHQTTYLILDYLLDMELSGKVVLDMGCGSGILGIFAAQKSAQHVTYIDIDEWPVANTIENLQRNNTYGKVIQGGAESIPKEHYQVILANINKLILLNDMHAYVAHMSDNGHILFSGFYENDLEDIKAKAQQLGLNYVKHKLKDNWCMAHFCK
jgi:ribosomal protein L11 methyltransferase